MMGASSNKKVKKEKEQYLPDTWLVIVTFKNTLENQRH